MGTKITPLLLVTAVCAANVGCASYAYNDSPSFYYYAARNVVEAPAKCTDTLVMLYRDRKRAEAAWRGLRQACPDQSFSLDYADGFKEGYVHYLEVGTAHPPAVPPACYRLSCYQNPAGLAAIQDWFTGFRHGTALAQVSGYRETIVLPLSDPPVNAVPRPGRQAADAEAAGPPAEPPGPPDELPAPRPVPPPPPPAPEVPPVGAPGPEVRPLDPPGVLPPADPPGALGPGAGRGRPE